MQRLDKGAREAMGTAQRHFFAALLKHSEDVPCAMVACRKECDIPSKLLYLWRFVALFENSLIQARAAIKTATGACDFDALAESALTRADLLLLFAAGSGKQSLLSTLQMPSDGRYSLWRRYRALFWCAARWRRISRESRALAVMLDSPAFSWHLSDPVAPTVLKFCIADTGSIDRPALDSSVLAGAPAESANVILAMAVLNCRRAYQRGIGFGIFRELLDSLSLRSPLNDALRALTPSIKATGSHYAADLVGASRTHYTFVVESFCALIMNTTERLRDLSAVGFNANRATELCTRCSQKHALLR